MDSSNHPDNTMNFDISKIPAHLNVVRFLAVIGHFDSYAWCLAKHKDGTFSVLGIDCLSVAVQTKKPHDEKSGLRALTRNFNRRKLGGHSCYKF